MYDQEMLSLFGIIPEGHVLDVPNAMLGAIYYAVWLLVFPYLPKGIRFLFSSLASFN